MTGKKRRLIQHIWVILTSPFFAGRRKKMFSIQREKGTNSIPILLICFNRVSYIKQMVSSLEQHGFSNIYLTDNDSTYGPLIEYYKDCNHPIFYMKENHGHMAFCKSNIFAEYRNNFYVVTDPDLEIGDDCTGDFLDVMLEQLEKHFLARKVGFSLKINDLPDCNKYKSEIVKRERQYYKKYIKGDNVYRAAIDTTFALYLPDQLISFHDFLIS